MTLAPRELIIAYATFADPYGVGLYASAEALRQMAALLQTGEPADMALAAPPDDLVEAGAVRTFQFLPEDDGPIDIRTDRRDVQIVGGATARSILAATLENLADEPSLDSPVAIHADVEYFPDHPFLSENSMWMTVILLPAASGRG